MYSGPTVLFAVETSIDQLCDLLQLSEKDFDRNNEGVVSVADAWEDYNGIVTDRLLERGCPALRVFRLPCCNSQYTPTLFLGIYLGELVVAYRDNVDTFATFEAYEAHLNTMIGEMRVRARARESATQEIRKIIPDAAPQIYTFANDCDSCT